MNMALKKVSLLLLLITGVASTFANPEQRKEWREALRAEHQRRMAERQGEQIDDSRLQPRGDHVSLPQRPGQQSTQAPGGNFNNAAPNEARVPGRLTREEKRALRRQIHDAGQDIYSANH